MTAKQHLQHDELKVKLEDLLAQRLDLSLRITQIRQEMANLTRPSRAKSIKGKFYR